MTIIIENQILSPVDVYSLYIKAQGLLIEMYDNYQKRSYRNRFVIASPNGKYVVSIPLKKGKNSLLSSQVQISYDMPWINSLASTIKSCYGSAPYFDHYFSDLMHIFEKKHSSLFLLNNELRNFVFDKLDIGIPEGFTSAYLTDHGEGYVDIRDRFSPLKTPENSIDFVPYNQVFMYKTGFIPGLSIIDLMFNTGKYAYQYLISQPSK